MKKLVPLFAFLLNAGCANPVVYEDHTQSAQDTIPEAQKTFHLSLALEGYTLNTHAVFAVDSGFLVAGSVDTIHPVDNRDLLEQLSTGQAEAWTDCAALLRFNRDGKLEWIKRYPANGISSSIDAMIETGDGTFYVLKNDCFNGFVRGGFNILHLGKNGTELGRWSFHSGSGYFAKTMWRSPNGDFFVAGEHEGVPVPGKGTTVWHSDDNPSDGITLSGSSFENVFYECIGSDGETKWKKELGNSYYGGCGAGPAGQLLLAAEKRAGDGGYQLYAIDAKTGSTAWKQKLIDSDNTTYIMAEFPDSSAGVFTLTSADGKRLTHLSRYSSEGKILQDTAFFITKDFTLDDAKRSGDRVLFSGEDSDQDVALTGTITRDGKIALGEEQPCLSNYAFCRFSDPHVLLWFGEWEKSSNKGYCVLCVLDVNGKMNNSH